MPSISSPGIGSGLDIKAIVDALVKAEISPTKNRLDRQEANLSTQLSALGQIKSALAKLQTSIMKLTDMTQFQALTANVSDSTSLSASITSIDATTGNYQIQIQQLATQQILPQPLFQALQRR